MRKPAKTTADLIREGAAGNNGEAGRSPRRQSHADAATPARPTRKPRLPEPYQPFPVEVLPAPLAEYVRQGAAALGCDAAYLALPCLAVAAGMIGYTRVLRLKRSWRVPGVLWTLVIADSGSLKSPAFRMATDYLFTLQKRPDNEFKRKLAEYTEAKERWLDAVKAARKGEGDPPGDEPEPPARQTLFTSDATIEAVAELVGENPRGLVVACDELAGWLGSFTRYKGKAGGTDLPRWLSMHSAGGFAYHRKTGDRRRIVVPHAAVSVAGGIQPDILGRALSGEFLEAGLAGRLLMAMPPRPQKVWSELEIDPCAETRYHELLDALHRLEFGRSDGEATPQLLRLSPDAKAAWVRWYNEWAEQQGTVEGELAAAYSKLEEAAARFALLHHVVTRTALSESDLVPVEPESVEAGVRLARWFAREAQRVYPTLGESEEDREARRLVEYIGGRGGAITPRQLQRANARRYPTSTCAELALDSLVGLELADWQESPTTDRGGRPTRTLVLRPTTDTTDVTPNVAGVEGDEPPQRPTDASADRTPAAPGPAGEKEGCVGSVGRRAADASAPPGNGGSAKAPAEDGEREDVVSGTRTEQPPETPRKRRRGAI
jgi:hypothetical protein